ncbi:MAG: stage III sporulation AC/AD family protein [Clostridia bacterium]|nr:stage III sporulation AC/AD family protein [Clostridia bacterium]
MVQDIIKICGLSLICIIFSYIASVYKSEWQKPIVIAGFIMIIAKTLPLAKTLIDFFGDACAEYGFSGIKVIIAVLAIGVISDVFSQICRDFESESIGTAIGMFSKISSLIIILPLISKVFELIKTILNAE